MPYKNAYNKEIAQQVRFMSQNHVNREKEINDFATNYEIPSQVESSVMRHPEVHGGSGFAAATVGDPGIEPTQCATPAKAKTAMRRKSKDRGGRGPICGGCFGWWAFGRGREAHPA